VAEPPTDEQWLAAFRAAVEAQKRIFADHPGIADRSHYEGVGEGGDRTLAIDARCEDVTFDELAKLHDAGHEFVAIAEERGTVAFGDGGGPRVVLDPIDGSLNARRTVPCHSFSIAVADGETMADVTLGYVYEFGAREEFTAAVGGGATLGGAPISAPDGDGLELVALEASKPERVAAACAVLDGSAYRIRSPGTIAVGLCYVAAGRFDGLITTRPCRSVDAAAGQLIAREAGASLRFGAEGPDSAPLDLAARYHVATARTDPDLAILARAQEAVGT
jgi:myo-inositol-1(or 4)-monophosphatase